LWLPCDGARTAICRRRVPGGRFGGGLYAGPDVLDLVAVPAGEPDVRNSPALGETDLLAVLRRLRCDLGRDAVRPKLAGDVVSSKEDAGFDDDSDGFPSVCARLRDVQMQIESTLLEVARESSSQA